MSSNHTPKVSTKVSQVAPVGAPKDNKNAVKTGLYTTKTKDFLKAQRIRRRVNKKLEGVPSNMRPVLRENLRDIEHLNELLETMRDYFDHNGIVTEKGEPRRMLSEYGRIAKLKLDISNANGLTAASFAATRRDFIQGDMMALERWKQGGE